MWEYVAMLVVSFLVSYALAPKPQTTPPAGLEDVQAPTAEEGREIPVLFGTREIKAPNCVWYGDLRTTPVKK